MSKFFYKGKSNNHSGVSNASFGNNKTLRLGTKKAPAKLSVKSSERMQEVQVILDQNQWIGEIVIVPDQAENLNDLEILQAKTEQAISPKKASRNDPCPCGSQKKYKKCCGA